MYECLGVTSCLIGGVEPSTCINLASRWPSVLLYSFGLLGAHGYMQNVTFECIHFSRDQIGTSQELHLLYLLSLCYGKKFLLKNWQNNFSAKKDWIFMITSESKGIGRTWSLTAPDFALSPVFVFSLSLGPKLLLSLYLTAVEVVEVADAIEVASSLVALAQVIGQEPPFAVLEIVHV